MDKIWEEVTGQFRCGLGSIHGIEHWRRVEKNGLAIASETPGANVEVVRLFAVLHDSQRLYDHEDPLHGERAAAYAERLRGGLVHLDDHWSKILYHALRLHAKGLTSPDPTVGACWDADRLDLTRLDIDPDPSLMSTEAGHRMATAMLQGHLF
jgi:uncharacterized protein